MIIPVSDKSLESFGIGSHATNRRGSVHRGVANEASHSSRSSRLRSLSTVVSRALYVKMLPPMMVCKRKVECTRRGQGSYGDVGTADTTAPRGRVNRSHFTLSFHRDYQFQDVPWQYGERDY